MNVIELRESMGRIVTSVLITCVVYWLIAGPGVDDATSACDALTARICSVWSSWLDFADNHRPMLVSGIVTIALHFLWLFMDRWARAARSVRPVVIVLALMMVIGLVTLGCVILPVVDWQLAAT